MCKKSWKKSTPTNNAMRFWTTCCKCRWSKKTNGKSIGFQLWVNLPAAMKMSEPLYQEFDAEKIPVETRPGGVKVKVIAGATAGGTVGPVGGGPVDALYFDVTLPKGARFSEAVPGERAVMLVVYEGAISSIGGRRIDALGAAFLGPGDEIAMQADADSRFLLLAGKPIEEPVAWGGPFVMNSREEVMQAYQDYQSGKF